MRVLFFVQYLLLLPYPAIPFPSLSPTHQKQKPEKRVFTALFLDAGTTWSCILFIHAMKRKSLLLESPKNMEGLTLSSQGYFAYCPPLDWFLLHDLILVSGSIHQARIAKTTHMGNRGWITNETSIYSPSLRR